jgi:methyl-accepting chemotaxis protein
LTSKATPWIPSRKLPSIGSLEDKSQIINDAHIKTSFESGGMRDFSVTIEDVMIKVTEIEDSLEKVYSQLTYLTEKMEAIALMLSTLNQQGFQLQEDMTTMRSEKSGLLRWFK